MSERRRETEYAESLAVAIWENHWRADAPNWKPLSGDLIGILTQIDNMTAGLVRQPPTSPEHPGRATDEEVCITQRIFDAFANLPGPTPMKAIGEAFAAIRAEGSAERAKLEAACRPFADAHFYYNDAGKPDDCPTGIGGVTYGDFRRLVSVLAALAKPAESGATETWRDTGGRQHKGIKT